MILRFVGTVALLRSCCGLCVERSRFQRDNGWSDRPGEWAIRLFEIAVAMLQLEVNLAGVKLVVKLQFALLIILLISALNFMMGTSAWEQYIRNATSATSIAIRSDCDDTVDTRMHWLFCARAEI